MKKSILAIATLGLFSAAIMFAPAVQAADESKPPKKENAAAEKSAAAKPEKKPRATPLRGTVAAVDANAGTITVGARTFNVTADTKISKQAKPATLGDATLGEKVTGSYLKGDDGKLNAVTLKLSPAASGEKPAKPEGEEAKPKKKEKADK